MIITIIVKQHAWSSTIEMEDSSTFDDLHYVIQQAIEFDNDHLYEFYLAKSDRSRDRHVIASYEDADEFTVKDIFPTQDGKKLFYLFDYGDNWVFQISQVRKAPFSAVSGAKYPQLIRETGEKPVQHPDWEE